ncbi:MULTISPECIES: UbiA-like protein EboC [Maribacter]|uniref:UbiA-like protein EboC n=1 Tax=Maribacter flavus TaxID=1658664 RepID=A0A5B2TSA7_9FLAO|nr:MULTISPECIES: UbiA-like protein EboC [Maribacter]KAA2216515.1 ubiquinone biosynthesis protein UbiA [Maribacter flavus]MDC6406774.1 UbiA-like protein EboC [Maribacter sp. PR66]MEE1973784.1 UbiA-like protein EboC [Maribacter flavus]
MMKKIMGFARLARPANLPTAAADIFAGISLALFSSGIAIPDFFSANGTAVLSLVFASVFLYAGGVVFNDVFDAKLDAVERPERPIPSGLIPKNQAALWGVFLFFIGLYLAFSVHQVSGSIAGILIFSILVYDALAKKHSFFGPLVMGICRGLNLLLGMSILGQLEVWWVSVVPMIYIFAITLISRGEVHGDNKNHIAIAGFLYMLVLAFIAITITLNTDRILISLPFIVLFGFLVIRPLLRAYRENSPRNIKKAVMAGVLSLIVMDACWVAGFSHWYVGLLVLLLLPLSLLLSRIFAVT